MIDSLSIAMRADSRWRSAISVYSYRIILVLSLLVSAIILAIQFPITIYSPDGSFHAAKILRASHGEFFIDPFTGIPTIYPSLFHVCFGLLNRVLGLNPIQIVQLIILVDFIGLFAAFYYLTIPFLRNAEDASLCILSLALVFYAPTSHYILIAQPSSFSFVSLIFGIGALYRYLMNPRVMYLVLGGLLTSVAVNIWWPNVFSVCPILLVHTYYAVRRRIIAGLSHGALFILGLLMPCIFTIWHLYSIWDVLPNYGSNSSSQMSIVEGITTWIVTFVTKGNLQFVHHFNFWGVLGGAHETGSLLNDGIKRLYSLASSVHYFLLVLPFNLLLVAYACLFLTRKDKRILTNYALARTLAISALLVLLFSVVAVFMWDQSVSRTSTYLRRVHFIIYILLLLFAFATAPFSFGKNRLRQLSIYVCVASLFSVFYTVIYSPRVFTSRLPEPDNEIVRFISSIPNHDHELIFMSDESLRKLAPFVTFRSFVARGNGRYYHQDPMTSSKMYQDFQTIRDKTAEWEMVVHQRRMKWFIFKISEATEDSLFRQYANNGSVVWNNGDWAVLKLTL